MQGKRQKTEDTAETELDETDISPHESQIEHINLQSYRIVQSYTSNM